MRSLLVSFLASTCLLSSAQKIATVDFDSVMKCLPEYQVAMHRLDSVIHRYEDTLQYLQKRFEEDLNTHITDRQWTKEQLELEQQELQEQQERIQTFQQQAQEKIAALQQRLYEPVKNKTRSLCVNLSKEMGFDLLVDNPTAGNFVLFTESPLTDITAEVIKRIK